MLLGRRLTNSPIYKGIWSGRPSPTSFPNQRIIITDYNNTIFVSDGTLWRPAGKQILIYSTTTVSGLAQTAEQILRQLTIPGIMLCGCRFFSIGWTAFVTTTVDNKTVGLRIGTTGTLADTSFYTTTFWTSASTSKTASGGIICFVPSTLDRIRRFNASQNFAFETGGSTTTAFPDDKMITGISTSDLILSLTVSQNVGTDVPNACALTIIGE